MYKKNQININQLLKHNLTRKERIEEFPLFISEREEACQHTRRRAKTELSAEKF